MKRTTTEIRQTRILNGYRAAAGLMSEAKALHRAEGNTDAAHDAYRHAAQVTRAARELDRSLMEGTTR